MPRLNDQIISGRIKVFILTLEARPATYVCVGTLYGLKLQGMKEKYDVLGILPKHFSPSYSFDFMLCDFILNHQTIHLAATARMPVIIIKVFLLYEHRSFSLQCCYTIPLMSTACVCQMVYHWLPWCNAQIACTPIQLKASIKWK